MSHSGRDQVSVWYEQDQSFVLTQNQGHQSSVQTNMQVKTKTHHIIILKVLIYSQIN